MHSLDVMRSPVVRVLLLLLVLLNNVNASKARSFQGTPRLEDIRQYEIVNIATVGRHARSVLGAGNDLLKLPPRLEIEFEFKTMTLILQMRVTTQHTQEITFTDSTPPEQIPVATYDGRVIMDGVVTDNIAHVNVRQIQPLVIRGFFYLEDDMYHLEPHTTSSGEVDGTVVYRERDWEGYVDPGQEKLTCGTGEGHAVESTKAKHPVSPHVLPRSVPIISTQMAANLGVFVDCNVYASNGYSATTTTATVMAALSFANQRYLNQLNLFLQLASSSIVISPNCSTNPTSFQQNCANSDYSITDRLYDFSYWRGQRSSTEGVWVDLTNCYQPTVGGTAVGLAWTRSICTTTVSSYQNATAAAVVSRVTTSDEAFYIVFAHEIGHVFAAIHDEIDVGDITTGQSTTGTTGCSQYDISDPSTYIMATVVPTNPSASITFSQCTVDWISYNIQNYDGTSGAIAPCLVPFGGSAISTISPVDVAVNVATTFSVSFNSQYLTSSSLLGLTTSSCTTATIQVIVPLDASFVATLTSAGTYSLCFSSNNGTYWSAQGADLIVYAIAATSTSISAISPSYSSTNFATNISFTGTTQLPTAKVGFSLFHDCSVVVGVVSVASSSEVDISPIAQPGLYQVCYQTDGVNWVAQSSDITLNVIGQIPTLITDITPSVVAVDTIATFSTNETIYTPQTRVALSQDASCSSVDQSMVATPSNTFTMIAPIVAPNNGVYRICVSTTSGASYVTQTNVTIAIAVPPDQSSNLNITSRTPSQISLKWTDGFNGLGPVTAYTLLYHIVGSSTISNLSFVNTGEQTGLITGLIANTSYSIEVIAINIAGPSNPSAPVVVSTLPPTVPSAVPSLSSLSSPTTVDLTWLAPSETGGLTIIGYTVTITGAGFSTTVSTTTTSVEISGLKPGASYTVSVVATNSLGSSQPSIFFVTTADAFAPSAPVSVASSDITTSSFTVTWETPTSNGNSTILDYWVVYYFNVNGSLVANVTSDLSLSLTINGVAAGTAFNVYVYARNVVGFSPASSQLSVTTEPLLLNTIESWLSDHVGLVAGVAAGVLVLAILVVTLSAWACRRKNQRNNKIPLDSVQFSQPTPSQQHSAYYAPPAYDDAL